MGIKRQLTGDALPALLASPIQDITRHTRVRIPRSRAADRFAHVEAALERFGDEKAIVLNLRDGFSDMRDLLGYEGSLMSLLLEPQAFRRAAARGRSITTCSWRPCSPDAYGLEIVATTDDVANATGLLMRPETYFERDRPSFRQVIQGYKELGYLCIKHCDGNIDAVIDFWIECGIDCLDPIDPGAGYTMAA